MQKKICDISKSDTCKCLEGNIFVLTINIMLYNRCCRYLNFFILIEIKSENSTITEITLFDAAEGTNLQKSE